MSKELISRPATEVTRAFGYWHERSGRWEVNCSEILSILMREAVRNCKRFESDLFISWMEVETALQDPDYAGGEYYFGFREDGVDHETFIRLKEESPEIYGKHVYKALWRLSVKTRKEDIQMRLFQYPDRWEDDTYERIRDAAKNVSGDALAEVLCDAVYGSDGKDSGFEPYEAAKGLLSQVRNAKTDEELRIIDGTTVSIIGWSLGTLLKKASPKKEEAK